MQNYYYGNEKNSNENIPEENCYYDSSGEQKNYKILFSKLKAGDTLYLESLSSLGDTTEQIQHEWDRLREANVEIVVCDFPELDTTKLAFPTGRYIAYILKISDMMQKNYVKRWKDAQKIGIKKAQENGVHFGRPYAITLEDFKKNYNTLSEKGFTDKDIYKIIGISSFTGNKYKQIMNGTYVPTDRSKKSEHLGRPYIMELEKFTKLYTKYKNEKLSDEKIYEKLGISRSTGKKYKRKMLQEKEQ